MAFPFTGRVEVVWLMFGGMAYVYYLVLRLRKGLPRLLALLPLLPFLLVVPWRLPTAAERSVFSFVFVWMILSKLVLLVWDYGPAADPGARASFPRFLVALASGAHMIRDPKFYSVRERDEVGVDNDSRSDKSQGIRRRFTSRDGEVVDSVKRKQAEEDTVRAIGGNGKGVESKYPKWVQTVWTSKSGEAALLRSGFYFMIYCTLAVILLLYKSFMSYYVLVVFLGFLLYFSCLAAFLGSSAMVAIIFGGPVDIQYDNPWLASSLGEFWAGRWNLLVSNLLRVSVWEPVLRFIAWRRDGGKVKKPVPARDKAVATAAGFLVSGLMHDMLVFYSSRSIPSFEMTGFFVVNGAATLLERYVTKRHKLGRLRVEVPLVLKRVYTVGFVYLTACWLLFPPIIRNGAVDQCHAEAAAIMNWVIGIFTRIVQSIHT